MKSVAYIISITPQAPAECQTDKPGAPSVVNTHRAKSGRDAGAPCPLGEDDLTS
jgi:hypothetical protein